MKYTSFGDLCLTNLLNTLRLILLAYILSGSIVAMFYAGMDVYTMTKSIVAGCWILNTAIHYKFI